MNNFSRKLSKLSLKCLTLIGIIVSSQALYNSAIAADEDKEVQKSSMALLSYPSLIKEDKLQFPQFKSWREALIVPHEDLRHRVTNTAKNKYNAIGYLEITFPKGSGSGSGTLISLETVLTAAHCLYSKKYGGYATRITFIPARNGHLTGREKEKVSARAWKVPDEWIEEEEKDIKENERQFDYGVIALVSEVESNFFSIKRDSQERLIRNKSYRVTGYPGESDKDGQMWTISGALYKNERDKKIDDQIKILMKSKFDKGILLYGLDTSGGQSGGPIWTSYYCDRGCCRYNLCVGVHSGVFAVGINRGMRLKTSHIKKIQELIKELSTPKGYGLSEWLAYLNSNLPSVCFKFE